MINKQIENLSRKKDSLDGLNIKMSMTERASKLEDRSVEMIQSEEQRGRKISKKLTGPSVTYVTISKDLTFM